MSKLQEVFWTSEGCCIGIAWFHSRDLTITEGFSYTQSFHRDFLQIFTHLHTSVRATERKLQHFKWGLGHEAFVWHVLTIRQTQWVVQQRPPTPLWTLEFSKHFLICTLTFACFDSSSNPLCCILKWNEFTSPPTSHAASFSRHPKPVKKIHPWTVLSPSSSPVIALLIAVVSI